MNSFISFSFDRDTIWRDSVGVSTASATNLGLTSTFLLAFVSLHVISYLAFLASAKVHKRKQLLLGVSRWSVFFTMAAMLAVLTIEVYRNYYGSEDIAESNTVVAMANPTAGLDEKYHAQEETVREDYKGRIAKVQETVELINSWTGKKHYCTKTGCPTAKKGKGTIGCHWKGTLTAFGSKQLATLAKRIETLEDERDQEINLVRDRKDQVLTASISSYQQDVDRYNTEISLKNNTFKGFVFIAFPTAFIIAFLLSDITFLGIEYLYETERLERPYVPEIRLDGKSVRKTPTVSREGNVLTDKLVQERFKRRECVNCGTDIQHKRKDAKTCSDGCRIAYNEWKSGYSVKDVIANRKRAKSG